MNDGALPLTLLADCTTDSSSTASILNVSKQCEALVNSLSHSIKGAVGSAPPLDTHSEDELRSIGVGLWLILLTEDDMIIKRMKEDVNSCVFCKIILDNSQASVVWQDNDALAIMDIQPVNPGHVLLVPKRHVQYLANLDESIGAKLWTKARQLAEALRKSSLKVDGVNLFLADGEAAGQEIFHLHLHIFPRIQGDQFKISYDWSTRPSRDELDKHARLIANSLAE